MLLNLHDYEGAASEALEPGVFDFVAGGACDEHTVRRNRSAFDALTLNPRYVRDVTRRDLATTMLGDEVSLPVFISPAGLLERVHPDGERAAARGAGLSRTLMIVSSFAAERLPAVAAATTGPLWLQ